MRQSKKKNMTNAEMASPLGFRVIILVACSALTLSKENSTATQNGRFAFIWEIPTDQCFPYQRRDPNIFRFPDGPLY